MLLLMRLYLPAVISVVVPLASGTAAPVAIPPPSAVQMQGQIGFLIENDENLRRAMGQLLEKWGVDVLEASSGEEALALIDELGIAPDFMLIDQGLGTGISGLDVIAELRARFGDLPLRLLTADRSATLRAQTEAAAVKMVLKPVDAQGLRAVMAEFGLTTKGA